MPMLEEIHEILTNFNYFSCLHVYKERNRTIESLSKEGLQMGKGQIKALEINEHIKQYYYRSLAETKSLFEENV